MNHSVYQIGIANLLLSFIPVALVIGVFYRWSISISSTVQGLIRMVIQLLLIGYALTYIFSNDQPIFVIAILCFMLTAAGFIALRPMRHKDRKIFGKALLAIAVGGIFTLVIVIGLVLSITPTFNPRYVIPLAGMIFANAMNAVSLGAERFESEIAGGKDYQQARAQALKTSLIPITNSLFAVGLVSLPGMMTGQILSGISPLIAVRYQIMVMCMVFGAAGISSAVFLRLQRNDYDRMRKTCAG
jgi:putative ABC transport system permease protein